MAEIIQVKNARSEEGGGKAGGYSDEMLACILGTGSNGVNVRKQNKILATIISPQGIRTPGDGHKDADPRRRYDHRYDRRGLYRE